MAIEEYKARMRQHGLEDDLIDFIYDECEFSARNGTRVLLMFRRGRITSYHDLLGIATDGHSLAIKHYGSVRQSIGLYTAEKIVEAIGRRKKVTSSVQVEQAPEDHG